jgi:hypothetical protein
MTILQSSSPTASGISSGAESRPRPGPVDASSAATEKRSLPRSPLGYDAERAIVDNEPSPLLDAQLASLLNRAIGTGTGPDRAVRQDSAGAPPGQRDSR